MDDRPTTSRLATIARHPLFSPLLIAAAGILVYANSFTAAFHLDDLPSIVNNPAIRHLSDWKTLWLFWPTRFISYLTLAFNYAAHHLWLPGYHAVNLMIHLATSFCVWSLAKQLFRTIRRDDPLSAELGALAAALLFVAHPIQTQAVTYIVQRSTGLAALFSLATFIFYDRARRENSGKHFWFALLSALAASFSKENTIALPWLLLLYEIHFADQSPGAVKRLAPFFVVSLLIPLAMLLSHSVDPAAMKRVVEEGPGISPRDYLITQLPVLNRYLELIVLPIHQTIDHQVVIVDRFFCGEALDPFILHVGLAIVAGIAFSKNRLLSFSIFWFYLSLVPESGLVPIKDLMFEHRLYLPMLGPSLLVGLLISRPKLRKNSVGIYLLTALILTCGWLSLERNQVWSTEWSLWNDAVKKSPGKARPYLNRGYAEAMEGKTGEAVADLTQALKLDPGNKDALSNLGMIHSMNKDYTKAIEVYSQILEKNANDAEVLANRGLAYQSLEKFSEALADYDQAIKLKPAYAIAFNNRGLLYQEKGDYSSALADYRQALAIDPGYIDAYNNRANAYQELGKTEKAVKDYTHAIELDPDNASLYSNRGIALASSNHIDEAITDFKTVVRLLPKKAGGYSALGSALFVKGKTNEAIAEFTRAIELDKGLAGAYHNRAAAYFSIKDYPRCREDLDRAKALGYSLNPKLVTALEQAESPSDKPRPS